MSVLVLGVSMALVTCVALRQWKKSSLRKVNMHGNNYYTDANVYDMRR